MGELGSILLQCHPSGRLDYTDGRFEERKAILEPLIDTVMAALNIARR